MIRCKICTKQHLKNDPATVLSPGLQLIRWEDWWSTPAQSLFYFWQQNLGVWMGFSVGLAMLLYFRIDGLLQNWVFLPLQNFELGWRLFSGLCGDLLMGNKLQFLKRISNRNIWWRWTPVRIVFFLANWLADESKGWQVDKLHQPSKVVTFPYCGGPVTTPIVAAPSGTEKDASPSPTRTFWEAIILLFSLGPSALHLRLGRVVLDVQNRSLRDARKNKSTFNAVVGDALLFESVVVNGKACDNVWPQVELDLASAISQNSDLLTVVSYIFLWWILLEMPYWFLFSPSGFNTSSFVHPTTLSRLDTASSRECMIMHPHKWLSEAQWFERRAVSKADEQLALM